MTGTPALPSWEHLVGASNSLLKQSESGKVPPGDEPGHNDSWGIGWFDGAGRISLLRQTGSAAHSAYFVFASETASRSAAGSGPAHILVGHLRKASVGAVTSENAHPIRIDPALGEEGDPLLLAHNGTLRGPLLKSLRADLREVDRGEAVSDNDTVVLAAWLWVRTASAEDRGAALADSLRELIGRSDGDDYTAINLLAAFPGELWALRCFRKNPDYYTLWRRPLGEETDGWLVASERTDDAPGWTLLEPGILTELTAGARNYKVGL